MWYWIGLIWIATLAGGVWAYRSKRKKREALRAKQSEALLAQFKVKPDLPAGDVDTMGQGRASAAPVRRFSRKQRVMPQPSALLYYVFRAGLPDHEIFAGLTLSDLVDVESALPGYNRDQTIRKLTLCRLDLVVCNKQLEVIAAVLSDAGVAMDAGQAENARFAEECLQSAGIRLVRIDAKAPPRHQGVRDLVYRAG